MLKASSIIFVIFSLIIHYQTSYANRQEEILQKDTLPKETKETIKELTSSEPKWYLTKETTPWAKDRLLCGCPIVVTGFITFSACIITSLCLVSPFLEGLNKVTFLRIATAMLTSAAPAGIAISFGYATKKLWTPPQTPRSTKEIDLEPEIKRNCFFDRN
jgi:hypothetical protein